MQTILYQLDDALYLNLTNRCPCQCTFCIRQNGPGVGDADSLWLDHEPDFGEVKSALSQTDLSNFREVVFCGYGEPFCAFDVMLQTLQYLGSRTSPPIRINTNGLGDMIQQKRTAPMLKGLCDAVSVSLNAADAEGYFLRCRPSFGPGSFDAMLAFASDCADFVPHVNLSVVDCIGDGEMRRCEQIAGRLGLPLRVRSLIG